MQVFRFARERDLAVMKTSEIANAAHRALGAFTLPATLLLVSASDRTMHGFLICDDAESMSLAASSALADAVGGRVERSSTEQVHALFEEDTMPVASVQMVATGRWAHNPMVDSDPTSLPKAMANESVMTAGSWIAVSFRPPANRKKTKIAGARSTAERPDFHAWLSFQRNRSTVGSITHHALTSNAVVMSAVAGSVDGDADVILRTLASGMPGFDVDIDTKPVSTATVGLPQFGIAALALAATIGVRVLTPTVTGLGVPSVAVWAVTSVLLLVGLVCLVVGVMRKVGLGRSTFEQQVLRGMPDLEFPPPPVRASKPEPPRDQRKTITKDDEGNTVEKIEEASEGDYPLNRHAFMVGFDLLSGLVAPQAGARSGEVTSATHNPPPVTAQRIGPVIGFADDTPVHLDAGAQRFGGVAVFGQPGSGKSQILRALTGWNLAEKRLCDGVAGGPGRTNGIVSFFSKNYTDLDRMKLWTDAVGEPLIMVDVRDESTPAIGVFDVPGDLATRTRFRVDAMRYMFGEDAIGPRSTRTLNALLPLAIVTSEMGADLLDGSDKIGVEPGRSEWYYATVLHGWDGSLEAARQFVAGIKAAVSRLKSDDERKPVFEAALRQADNVFALTPSQQQSAIDAPSSKVSQMAEMEWFFTPSRPRYSWDQILDQHLTVGINLAAPRSREVISGSASEALGSLMLFSLVETMMRVCVDWEEQDRFTSLFTDELSLLVGQSPEKFVWLREQGRAAGVRVHAATQRLEQLHPQVRDSLLNYVTLASFKHESTTTADPTLHAIAPNDPSWTVDDLLYMPPWHAAVRTSVAGQRQQPYILNVADLETDIQRAVYQLWGYRAEQSTPVDNTSGPDLVASVAVDPATDEVAVAGRNDADEIELED